MTSNSYSRLWCRLRPHPRRAYRHVVAQAERCFLNIRAILAEGGAEPRHLVRLTWYVTDIEAYLADPRGLGEAYRTAFGRHYPTMAVVEVKLRGTKELALEALIDTGYKVLDHFYAPRSKEIGPDLIQKIFRMPRALFYAIHRDLAVRVLGGYSLMVLAT